VPKLLILAVLLTGCSTQQLMCAGTGTCQANTDYTGISTANRYTSPQVVRSVQLPTGNYLIVPNHSTGGISAVIQTSKTK
jgi:hypothetical protein